MAFSVSAASMGYNSLNPSQHRKNGNRRPVIHWRRCRATQSLLKNDPGDRLGDAMIYLNMRRNIISAGGFEIMISPGMEYRSKFAKK